MHLGNRYSLASYNIQENKKTCAHNYSRTAVYFERVSAVLGHFPKAFYAGYKSKFLKIMSLNFGSSNFQNLRN